MATDFSRICEFVSEAGTPHLRVASIVKLVRALLGEDDNSDSEGVTLCAIRRRLQHFVDPARPLTIRVEMLVPILQTLCLITLTPTQGQELAQLVANEASPTTETTIVAASARALPADVMGQDPNQVVAARRSQTTDELVGQLAVKSAELARSRKRERYWANKCQRLEQVIVQKNDRIHYMTSQLVLRPPGGYRVSVQGGYRLAWKRSLSNVGAGACVAALQEEG